MGHLLLVSLIWAFSFGLIAKFLPPAEAHPAWVAASRLLLALVVFIPFLRAAGPNNRQRLMLAGLGAVQFGIMYILYLGAFASLRPHEIALLTVFTPVFVWLGGDILDRTFRPQHVIAALAACLGAFIALGNRTWESGTLQGILMMQLSNVCFAAGQLGYRHLRLEHSKSGSDASHYAWMLVGGLAASLPYALLQTGFVLPSLSGPQILTLAYLGIIATGLGFFWWNIGATRVDTGVLAAANNAKIPLAVLVSIFVFSSQAKLLPTLTGLAVVVLAMLIPRMLPFNPHGKRPEESEERA